MRQNLKAVLLKVNVGGMELCWLYVLFVLLDKLLAVGIPFEPWYLIFYPLSICFHRVFLNKQSASVYSIVLSVFVWGLVWLIVMRSQTVNNLHLLDPTWFVKFFQTLVDVDRTLSPELFITVTSAIIWGISARLTTLKVSFSILLREFQLGFIILLVAFFIETQLKIQLTGAIPAVILLFFLALTSIPLTQVGESQNRLSGLPIGYKLIFTMVSIGTIFLLGLLVSLTLNPELLDVVLSILKSILDLILKIIRFLNGLFPAPEMKQLPAFEVKVPDNPFPSEANSLFQIPVIIKQVVGFALSLFWVFLALIVLWRISMSLVNWLRLKLSNSLEVEIESIEGAFWADILKLIKAIFNKMVTFVEIVKRLLGLTTKLKMVSPATKSIRHIYRDLLKWAAAAGCHRDTSQTPYEFLHVLAQRYPEGRTGFSIITTSYVNTRYGHHQLSRNQLDELKKQWRHLKRLRYKNKKQFQKGDNGQ